MNRFRLAVLGLCPLNGTVLLFLQLIEDLHDAGELRRVVVQLLQERVRGLLHSLFRVRVQLLSLLLGLQCLVDRLVRIDDESDDDVDEYQVGKLHEGDEVEDNGRVFLIVIDQLVHVDDLFPIVLPHQTEQRVERHHVVVEVEVEPRLIDVIFIVCDQVVYLLHVVLASEEFETYAGVDQI